MNLNKKYLLFFLIFSSLSVYAAYDYINLLKTSSIVNQNTYYFLKQNKTQKSIVEELQKNNVKISYFEWRLLSFLKEKNLKFLNRSIIVGSKGTEINYYDKIKQILIGWLSKFF